MCVLIHDRKPRGIAHYAHTCMCHCGLLPKFPLHTLFGRHTNICLSSDLLTRIKTSGPLADELTSLGLIKNFINNGCQYIITLERPKLSMPPTPLHRVLDVPVLPLAARQKRV